MVIEEGDGENSKHMVSKISEIYHWQESIIQDSKSVIQDSEPVIQASKSLIQDSESLIQDSEPPSSLFAKQYQSLIFFHTAMLILCLS